MRLKRWLIIDPHGVFTPNTQYLIQIWTKSQTKLHTHTALIAEHFTDLYQGPELHKYQIHSSVRWL